MKQKKNRLTLYILIALVLGIVVGYSLNKLFIDEYNEQIIESSAQIDAAKIQLLKVSDSNSPEYASIQNEIVLAQKVKSESLKIREDKLVAFTMMGDLFIRLIKMIVAPLVLTTLVVGVAKLGDGKAVGRIGGKTMLWFFSASFISLLLGLILVNIFRPGDSMNLPLPDEHLDTGFQKAALSTKDFITNIIPKSAVEAMATNNILQIIIFALFFGVATGAIGEHGTVIIKFFDASAHAILKVTGYVMQLAPVAVFGSMTAVIAKQGLSILSTYAAFMTEVYLSLIILMAVIIFAGYLVIGSRVKTMISMIKDPILLAFSTASSEAAFPRTMEQLERFGCNNKIVSFVLPLGYSFNLDGSMIYMTFASMFIAQAYDIHLSIGEQFTMLLILMLTSKGIAGVPRASSLIIVSTLATFNIPEVGIALILGVDPLLDMGRSATNVVGNSIATAVVCKWEGELGEMEPEGEPVEDISLS